MVFIKPGDRKAQCSGEILLVAQHHVDERCQAAVYFLRLRFPSNRLPERCSVVQIVRDHSAGSLGGFHGFLGDKRRGLGESAEDSAGVKPADAILGEDLIPVDLARFQLRDGGVPAVGATYCCANAEATLGEIQPVPYSPAYAIIWRPANVLLADAPLQHEVFDQSSDGIVSERGHNGRIKTEAALEPAGYVVFAAAFPGTKMTSGGNASIAGIEAQHDFAQAHQVPPAFTF